MDKLKIALCISILLVNCSPRQSATNTPTVVTEIPSRKTDLTPAQISLLDSANVNFQISGNCYAYSSKKNAIPSKGEAHSGNLPQAVNRSFPKNGLYLVINQKELSKIDSSVLACKLYLVNTTDSLVKLTASDSRLNIVAEALNKNNTWMPISYLPASSCGNSEHTVILGKNEFWSFNVPVFKGTIKTRLQYVLQIDAHTKIVSNEIVAHLNKGQFDTIKTDF